MAADPIEQMRGELCTTVTDQHLDTSMDEIINADDHVNSASSLLDVTDHDTLSSPVASSVLCRIVDAESADDNSRTDVTDSGDDSDGAAGENDAGLLDWPPKCSLCWFYGKGMGKCFEHG